MAREPGPGEVHPRVTVVVPTLAADQTLADCLESLENQTFSDFEVIVVDNSGRHAVEPRGRVRVIANDRNVGFGAAVNQAYPRIASAVPRRSQRRYHRASALARGAAHRHRSAARRRHVRAADPAGGRRASRLGRHADRDGRQQQAARPSGVAGFLCSLSGGPAAERLRGILSPRNVGRNRTVRRKFLSIL